MRLVPTSEIIRELSITPVDKLYDLVYIFICYFSNIKNCKMNSNHVITLIPAWKSGKHCAWVRINPQEFKLFEKERYVWKYKIITPILETYYYACNFMRKSNDPNFFKKDLQDVLDKVVKQSPEYKERVNSFLDTIEVYL